MEFIQYSQEHREQKIEEAILALEDTAWPRNGADEGFPSAPNTYVLSFLLMENSTAVCHVGVRKSILLHQNEEYLAYGLSEVVTHPCYRRRGFAAQTIKKAAEFIIAQQADISIFTCAEEKVGFYSRCGWEKMPGTCFVGGTRAKPFRSDGLRLATMMMFLSQKAKNHRKDFQNADITFDLGENQLW